MHPHESKNDNDSCTKMIGREELMTQKYIARVSEGHDSKKWKRDWWLKNKHESVGRPRLKK